MNHSFKEYMIFRGLGVAPGVMLGAFLCDGHVTVM